MSQMADDGQLQRAATLLRAGQLIGLPTETVYGLAADAGNESAVAEVYRVKGRPDDHPLIVHVADLERARYWADFSEQVHPHALTLAQFFWPGPMTLIMNRREQAPGFACAGQSTVGLRIPSHPVAMGVLKRFHEMGGKGLAAPSANRFGRISPTSAQHVRDDLGEDIAWVLEGGNAKIGIESTIIDLTRKKPVILRPGHLSEKQLEGVLGFEVPILQKSGKQKGLKNDPNTGPNKVPKVSGSLDAHYAPLTPLEMLPLEAFAERLVSCLNKGEALALWVSTDLAIYLERVLGHQVPGELMHFQIASADPEVFAQDMYASMREMDALEMDRILVEALPEEPPWQAVLDRLKRAQTGSGRQENP